MYQYHTILFDLDGTLTDPGKGITNSVAYALEKWDIQITDRRQLYKFIGPPLIDSFMEFYGFSEEDAERAVEYYRDYFSKKGIYENEIYPGMEKLLQEIKASGREIVLATSKPEEFAKIILEHFHIAKYFDFIAGATMDGSRSKKADVIRYALQGCNVADHSRTVMIGDRNYDIIGAKEAGIASIGVLYGYGDYEELQQAGADHIAERVEDILSLL